MSARLLQAIGRAFRPNRSPEYIRDFVPKPRYVVWYIGPRPYSEKTWIAVSPDCEGVYSVRNKADATRFTKEEALRRVPVYDGSGGLDNRTGIET